jgi:hypothetical protein
MSYFAVASPVPPPAPKPTLLQSDAVLYEFFAHRVHILPCRFRFAGEPLICTTACICRQHLGAILTSTTSRILCLLAGSKYVATKCREHSTLFGGLFGG